MEIDILILKSYPKQSLGWAVEWKDRYQYLYMLTPMQ